MNFRIMAACAALLAAGTVEANAAGFEMNPVADMPYTLYTFTAPATGTDIVSLGFRNDPSYDAVDNISVTEDGGPNLILNGSFETGSLADWNFYGNTGYTYVEASGDGGYSAQDGDNYLLVGPIGSDGFIDQSFTDTPGGTLTYSVWIAGNGTTPSDMCMTNTTLVLACSVLPTANAPEPASMALLGGGLLALGAARRKTMR